MHKGVLTRILEGGGILLYNSSKQYQLSEVHLNTQGDLYYQNHAPQQITYNAFKKPVSIYEEGDGRVDFEYGPLQNRTHAYYGGLQSDKTQRQYHKQYSSILPIEMIEDTTDGSIKIISYIGGDGYTAPIAYIKQTGSNAINEYHYLHRDYLGSILAITDSSGTVQEERQFGAWGQADKFVDSDGNTTFTHSSLIGRGYTGHEHFFEVNLIHMNGRMYDANLGRFLSPDNYIQDPFNTQSFNRYGYVQNNPLINVDYSGESFWRSIGKWIKKHAKVITLVATIAVAVVATVATAGMASPLLAATIIGASAGFTAGAVGTWTNGGSFLEGLGNGAIQGLIGAASGFAGGAVGQWAAKGLGNVIVQGFNVTSHVVKGVIGGAIGGAAGGYAGSFAAGAISTGSLKGAHQAGLQGLALGAGIGALAGGVSAYRTAKAQKYHYTSKEAAMAISEEGLKVGKDGYSYLTNDGTLQPLQAKIELALPVTKPMPNALLRIETSGLSPEVIRNVQGNLHGLGAGGGKEFLFNQTISPARIKIIKTW